MTTDPRIAARADQLRERFPDAVQPPYWWLVVRPAVKVVCLTIGAAPGVIAAVDGFNLSPEGKVFMALLSLIAGYTLSEMSPGFRPRGR